MAQRAVIVSDSGDSWLLTGDLESGGFPYEQTEDGEECQTALPKLLEEGWKLNSVAPGGGGGKDENCYWLVIVQK